MINNENIYQSILQELSQIPMELLPEVHHYLEGIIQRTQIEKNKEKTKTLNDIKAYFKQKPVEKVWVFGSFARNTMTDKSDIDLLVRFVQPNNIDLFDYVGMKQDLEDITGFEIDLVEEGQALQTIQPNIEQDKVLIYELQTNE